MQGKYFIKKHISNRPRERCSLLNNTSFKMVASWHGIVTKKRNIKHTSMITLFFYGRILNYMKLPSPSTSYEKDNNFSMTSSTYFGIRNMEAFILSEKMPNSTSQRIRKYMTGRYHPEIVWQRLCL